jgi:hypothetical protein
MVAVGGRIVTVGGRPVPVGGAGIVWVGGRSVPVGVCEAIRVFVGRMPGGEVGQEVAEGSPDVGVGAGVFAGVEVIASVGNSPGVRLGTGYETVSLGIGVELG